MAYQVLYRRFRSKSFSEIIGQEHITSALRNQISSGKIAHSYLFTGSKGTGKTSTARVFALAVNCMKPVGGEACGECDSCKTLTQSTQTDIIEIDAASNRGIDEIRQLRENISYMPSIGKYRVYIIDEVHMLTTEAFNAMLKTLEEPPEHVIFIFCTTEANKIPPTILSRCQRFDFQRISEADILSRLQYVCGEIGVKAAAQALMLIARNSDGALRDALSFLDKAVSLSSGEEITEENVREALGMAGEEDIEKIAEAVCEQDAKKALLCLKSAIDKGRDVGYITNQLIAYFRNLMVYILCGDTGLSFISEDYNASLKRAGVDNTEQLGVVAVTTLSKVRQDSKALPSPRYLLEAALVYLSDKNRITETLSLTSRVQRLEKKLEAGEFTLPAGETPIKHGSDKALTDKQGTEAKAFAPAHAQSYEAAAKPSYDQSASANNAQSGSFDRSIPKTDRDVLAKMQEKVVFAGKYLFNKEMNIVLSSIISELKVKGYDKGVLYLAPTGTALNMMDVFNAKNGPKKLSDVLFETTKEKIEIVIAQDAKTSIAEAQKPQKPKSSEEVLKDVFGDTLEAID